MRRRTDWSGVLGARQGSQALVEFGIVAILFVMILFGIVDFGLLLNGWMTVNAGAREAAREAAVGGKLLATVYPAAERYAPPGVSGSDLKVTANYCHPSGSPCLDYANTRGPLPAPYTCDGNRDYCIYTTESDDPDLTPRDNPGVTAGDALTLTVVADTFEVVTPLVRPFFGCPGTQQHCYVMLAGSTTMRFEGGPPP